MAFNNEHSLGQHFELHHAPDRPLTVDELAVWLSNVSALDQAEAFRFTDPQLMREEYQKEAERAAETVLADVRRDYYTVDESYRRYLLKQQGFSSFGVVEDSHGRRVMHVGESAVRRVTA